jgi:Ni/Fe-hydrogenase subunit HybB-like protein
MPDESFASSIARTAEALPQEGESALARHITTAIGATLAPPRVGGRLWILFLLLVISAGIAAYIRQLVYGLAVTGMRDYVSWGVYMTNFVFFIGVSHAGTLISAILRVTNAEWRRPITRMAEGITVFALLVGAPMVLIDMGRPDRLHHVIFYGRLNSPILWDVLSVTTYILGSFLYLYVASIPDFAILARRGSTGNVFSQLRVRIYRFFSLGYRGTPLQKHYLERALGTMAIVIIPVAVSVHTVVSWVFGMTLRPGWHSTIFGPYFVIGAIFSGTAGIVLAMAVFRRVYRLENYLTNRHFRYLGTLLLVFNVLYIYFTLSEYLTTWYGGESVDKRLVDMLMGASHFGPLFWGTIVFGLFVPAMLLVLPTKKSIAPIVIASILVNLGMWVKRYLIIIPTMLTPFIDPKAADASPSYFPTLVEWTITAAAFASFLLLFTLFAKFLPIISIWETVEGVETLGAARTGVNKELDQLRETPCAA